MARFPSFAMDQNDAARMQPGHSPETLLRTRASRPFVGSRRALRKAAARALAPDLSSPFPRQRRLRLDVLGLAAYGRPSSGSSPHRLGGPRRAAQRSAAAATLRHDFQVAARLSRPD